MHEGDGNKDLEFAFCLIERLLGKLIFDIKLKYSVFKEWRSGLFACFRADYKKKNHFLNWFTFLSRFHFNPIWVKGTPTQKSLITATVSD